MTVAIHRVKQTRVQVPNENLEHAVRCLVAASVGSGDPGHAHLVVGQFILVLVVDVGPTGREPDEVLPDGDPEHQGALLGVERVPEHV